MLRYSDLIRSRNGGNNENDVDEPEVDRKLNRLQEWPNRLSVSLDICSIKKRYDIINAITVLPLTEKQRREKSILWLEMETKKEIFRNVTGLQFATYPSIDCFPNEKRALENLYRSLHGNIWNNNRGWIGRTRSYLRPEMKVLEAEASHFDGLITNYHRGESTNTVVVDITNNDKTKNKVIDKATEPTAAKMEGFEFNCTYDFTAFFSCTSSSL